MANGSGKGSSPRFLGTPANFHKMRVVILEKVHSLDPLIRKEREELFIRNFNTKYKGLNKR